MKNTQTLHDLEVNLLGIQDKMLYFALKLTRDKEKARDLRQESCLKVLTNLDKYYYNSNFRAWVFMIMYNTFINDYRRNAWGPVVADAMGTPQLTNSFQNSDLLTPEGMLMFSEVTKALNSLAHEFKKPFTMHLSGYKYREIAVAMRIPIGTVKSRVFFARKQLKKLLVDYK